MLLFKMLGRKRVSAPKSKERSRSAKKYKSSSYKVSPLRGIVGTSTKAKFYYHEAFQLNPGVAGVPASTVFSANGCYDPNITGGGHQPRGFDQVMALYDHGVVVGCKATIWVENTDTTHSTMLTMLWNDSSTVFAAPDDIIEHPYSTTKMIANKGSGPAVTQMTVKLNPNKFLGRKSPLSDPDLKFSKLSNPLEQCFLHIYANPGSNSSDSQTNYCRILIEYDVVCIEPTLPSAS